MAYVSIETAMGQASRAVGCNLTQVPRKKIMYTGINQRGQSVIVMSPQSKEQAGGFFWNDITEAQAITMNQYDIGLVVFRTENGAMTFIGWNEIEKYLTRGAMKHNESEGNHWKLHLYRDHLVITGNPNQISLTTTNDNLWDRYLK